MIRYICSIICYACCKISISFIFATGVYIVVELRSLAQRTCSVFFYVVNAHGHTNSLLTAAGKLIGQTVVDFVAVLDTGYLVLQQMKAGLALAHVRAVRVDAQLRAQPIEALAKVNWKNTESIER